MAHWDAVWLNANLATMTVTGDPYGAIRNGALAVKDGRLAWLGPGGSLPGGPDAAGEVHDVEGAWITPGLVDCHTHLVFGGDRAGEFEARLQGASYEEIARAGGGILSTVRATRAADEEALYRAASHRLDGLLAEGVTTVEIKSGYGLETEAEMKMLRVARRLGRERPVTVQTTLLAAHALPEEFLGRREAYLDLVVEEMIPRAVHQSLADAVDAFCEGIAFTPRECARVLEAAREHGLGLRLHADQLTDSGGAALAASFGARSADHLEYTSAEGARAMAGAGTVAVLLPGAYYFLREERAPPVETFRDTGVPMAIATDANPGSSPLTSLLLALNMACTLFRMTPEEALAGVTRNAARALGMTGEVGALEVGARADLAVWDVGHPGELSYWMGRNPLLTAVRNGTVIRTAS
jgi:imidazolonepropionase